MSQCSDILKHLKSRPITAIEALSKYGCFRLAARIYDLKCSGHNIDANIIEYQGKKFAQYRLV